MHQHSEPRSPIDNSLGSLDRLEELEDGGTSGECSAGMGHHLAGPSWLLAGLGSSSFVGLVVACYTDFVPDSTFLARCRKLHLLLNR